MYLALTLQRENGMIVQELPLKLDCKTRWNSLPPMLNSHLRIQKPLSKIVNRETEYSYSRDEFKQMQSVCDGLQPLNDLVLELCSEKMDLLTAENMFKATFAELEKHKTQFTDDLNTRLKVRYAERRNTEVISMLKILISKSFYARNIFV